MNTTEPSDSSGPLTGPLIQALGTKDPKADSKNFKHIDDFLEDSWIICKYPELAYPHFMFTYWRQSAAIKLAHAPFMAPFELYVDYQGRTWRVIGASRMGDIWLTKHFDRLHGYDLRVDPNFELFSNWRNKADWKLTLAELLTLADAAGMKKQGDPLTSHKAADYLKRWTQGNKIPDRYIDLTPEQRQILQVARFKRSMDAT
jgi:hypothetical protein